MLLYFNVKWLFPSLFHICSIGLISYLIENDEQDKDRKF